MRETQVTDVTTARCPASQHVRWNLDLCDTNIDTKVRYSPALQELCTKLVRLRNSLDSPVLSAASTEIHFQLRSAGDNGSARPRADRTDSAHTIELRDFQLRTAGDNDDQLVQELTQFQLRTAGDDNDQLTQ